VCICVYVMVDDFEQFEELGQFSSDDNLCNSNI